MKKIKITFPNPYSKFDLSLHFRFINSKDYKNDCCFYFFYDRDDSGLYLEIKLLYSMFIVYYISYLLKSYQFIDVQVFLVDFNLICFIIFFAFIIEHNLKFSFLSGFYMYFSF